MNGWIKTLLISLLLLTTIVVNMFFSAESYAHHRMNYFSTWEKNPDFVNTNVRHSVNPVYADRNLNVNYINDNRKHRNHRRSVHHCNNVVPTRIYYGYGYPVSNINYAPYGSNYNRSISNPNPYFNRSRANFYFNR